MSTCTSRFWTADNSRTNFNKRQCKNFFRVNEALLTLNYVSLKLCAEGMNRWSLIIFGSQVWTVAHWNKAILRDVDLGARDHAPMDWNQVVLRALNLDVKDQADSFWRNEAKQIESVFSANSSSAMHTSRARHKFRKTPSAAHFSPVRQSSEGNKAQLKWVCKQHAAQRKCRVVHRRIHKSWQAWLQVISAKQLAVQVLCCASAVQGSAVQCSAVLWCAVHCSAVQ